jgi:hypothetical protein
MVFDTISLSISFPPFLRAPEQSTGQAILSPIQANTCPVDCFFDGRSKEGGNIPQREGEEKERSFILERKNQRKLEDLKAVLEFAAYDRFHV